MCTVLLPPGDNPNAVNKYSISYQILVLNFYHTLLWFLPEGGGRSVKHVAGIIELYLFVNCMCKGRFVKKGNIILLHGVNNIRICISI